MKKLLRYAAIAALLSPLTCPTPAAGDDSTQRPPILCYHFDEEFGNVLLDSSSTGDHGKLMGNIKKTEGKSGEAILLDGKSAFAIAPSTEALRLNKAATMLAWFKPSDKGGDGVIMVGGGCKNRIIATGNGTLNGSFNVGKTYCRANGNGIIPGAWNHVAATYDGVKTRLYLNGVMTQETQNKGGDFVFSGPIMIGCESGKAFFFDGAIDEVRIYDYALSADAVKRDYASTPDKLTPGERLKVVKLNLESQAAFLEESLRQSGGEFPDFASLAAGMRKTAKDMDAAEDQQAALPGFKKAMDGLLSQKASLESGLAERNASGLADAKTLIDKAAKDIEALKEKGLAYRPAQCDIDMAGIYARLATLDFPNPFKKASYLKSCRERIASAAATIRRIETEGVKDALRGPKGEFMAGVTYSALQLGREYETFKALGLNLCGNAFLTLSRNQFFKTEPGKLDEILGQMSKDGVNSMICMSRPDYFISEEFSRRKIFQDETTPGQWANYKGAWLIPAAPKDIPLKWVKEHEKVLKDFIRAYGKYKSLKHWDIWGESHPLSPFYADSPIIQKAYSKHLNAKYGSIERLNATWKTGFKDFPEILPNTKGEWSEAEWLNFRHVILANYIGYLTDVIKSVDDTRSISPVPDMDQMYPLTSSLDPYLLAKAGGIYKEGGIDCYAARRDKYPWHQLANCIDTNRSVTGGGAVWVGEMGHWVNHACPAHSNCTYPEEMNEWSVTAFLHGAKAVACFSWAAGDSAAGVGEEGDSFALMHSDFTPTVNAFSIAKTEVSAKNYEELWSCKPERKVAIYYPRLSAMLKKSGSSEMSGLHAIMSDCGFGVDPVDVEFLKERTKDYQVIVLPPAPYLETDAQKALLGFLKNGGIVIASSTGPIMNEWNEADALPELSAAFAAKNEVKDYAPHIKYVNKLGKGSVCIVANDLGRVYRQWWMAKGITGKIPIDFERPDNARCRESLLACLAKEGGIEPKAFCDKEGVETAVIGNGKADYLMMINHRAEAVEASVALNKSAPEVKAAATRDIFSLQPATIEKAGEGHVLKTRVEGHGVLAFPLN